MVCILAISCHLVWVHSKFATSSGLAMVSFEAVLPLSFLEPSLPPLFSLSLSLFALN